jgi:ribosome-binding protein aMBF1 (putative translation factor)
MTRHANASFESPVRAAREAAGLSPEGLAYKAGLSLRTVERIEGGQVTPRRATIRVIADVLGVEADSLMAAAAA